ncbi:hypothetical protein B4135_3363 [Caldibacillus debilis]|uniref:Uncharacterized protein n=1 Tax=Caldibacillus debilis TaxID=301148 RepID=A0A150LF31_9BACI|nr:hypothetical protein B4135_3363 [Caldibacillus debilis]
MRLSAAIGKRNLYGKGGVFSRSVVKTHRVFDPADQPTTVFPPDGQESPIGKPL